MLLAHRFGALVCAEGVETAEDLRVLMEMGCDMAQGFLFAQAMPPSKFLQTIARPGEPARLAPENGGEGDPPLAQTA